MAAGIRSRLALAFDRADLVCRSGSSQFARSDVTRSITRSATARPRLSPPATSLQKMNACPDARFACLIHLCLEEVGIVQKSLVHAKYRSRIATHRLRDSWDDLGWRRA